MTVVNGSNSSTNHQKELIMRWFMLGHKLEMLSNLSSIVWTNIGMVHFHFKVIVNWGRSNVMEVIFNFNNFTSNSFLIRHKHSADKFNSEGSLWIFFKVFQTCCAGLISDLKWLRLNYVKIAKKNRTWTNDNCCSACQDDGECLSIFPDS